MKYKITVEIDTESGDYDMQFNNLTNKEAGIDYNLAMKAMYAIFGDFERKQGAVDLGQGTNIIPSLN